MKKTTIVSAKTAIQESPRAVFFIENLGDSTLDSRLMEMETGGAPVFPHLDMRCIDRSGHPIKRNLYEVPVHIRDKVVNMRLTSGFQFAVYKRTDPDVPPHEYYSWPAKVQVNPFKAVHKNRRVRQRRQALGRLPPVFLGGRLLARQT